MKKVWLLMMVLISWLPTASHAQGIPVMDIANLIQDILQVINQIEEIDHAVESLTNEAKSLEHEASNLKSFNFNIVSQLNQTTAKIGQLIAKAEGMAYNVSQSLDKFNTLYPSQYGQRVTNAQLAVDALNRWNTSLSALKSTVQVQSQAVQNFENDQSALTDLIDKSQSAEGALQVAQVTNQLLALHTRQMIQEQQLKITQDHAAALEQARNLAAEEKARAVRQKFMTNSTHYTPQPVPF